MLPRGGLTLTTAARGYLMQTGRIVGSGPIAELRDLGLLRELYLGTKPSATVRRLARTVSTLEVI